MSVLVDLWRLLPRGVNNFSEQIIFKDFQKVAVTRNLWARMPLENKPVCTVVVGLEATPKRMRLIRTVCWGAVRDHWRELQFSYYDKIILRSILTEYSADFFTSLGRDRTSLAVVPLWLEFCNSYHSNVNPMKTCRGDREVCRHVNLVSSRCQ